MVDPDIVTRRSLALNEALADLERPSARDVNALITDRDDLGDLRAFGAAVGALLPKELPG